MKVDEREPMLKNVIRFAGKKTMRETAAVLSLNRLFLLDQIAY